MPSLKVIIIGGGLAGTLLANGLQRNRIEVTVYERLARDAKREGYQIRLGVNALIGMRACLDPDVLTSVAAKFGRAGGKKSTAPVIRNKAFDSILDLTKFPVYSKSAAITRTVLRDALAQPVDQAGNLVYGKQFSSYEIVQQEGRERVKVHFEDGSSDICDILIGADGSHSQVNRRLGLNNLHQTKSHVSFIAKTELPMSMFSNMSPQLHEKPVLSFSDNSAFYFAAYLPDKLESDIHSNDTVGRDGYDEESATCMFGIHIPIEHVPDGALRADNQTKWRICADYMKPWAAEYHEMLDIIKGCDIYAYQARISTQPKANWRADAQRSEPETGGHPRVWLLGDSMHAMLPTRGMGGNQSLRDTATLLPLLLQLNKEVKDGMWPSKANIARCCNEYESEMVPRAFNWVQKSGGGVLAPVDVETYTGRALMSIASLGMQMYYGFTLLAGLFTTKAYVDDAPELRS